MFKTIQELITSNTTSKEMLSIFKLRGHIVKRYEVIQKLDGKSFGIYLYKDNPSGERSLLTDIILEVSTIQVLDFVLGVYESTPRGEEFCLHFPLDSDALIRCHTKPSAKEHNLYKDESVGSLGIKGFTLCNNGDIKDIKYYFMRNSEITTKKFGANNELRQVLTTDWRLQVCIPSTNLKIDMVREDGQTYDMYSLTNYDSFSLEYLI